MADVKNFVRAKYRLANKIFFISIILILSISNKIYAVDLTTKKLNYEQAEYIFNFFGNKIEKYPEMTSTFSIIYQGNYYDDIQSTTYANYNTLNKKEKIQAFISAFNNFNTNYNNLSIYNYLFMIENRGAQNQFYIYAFPIGQTWGNSNIGYLQFYNSTTKNGVIKSIISYRDGNITNNDNYKYFRFTLSSTSTGGSYTQINFNSSMQIPIWYKITDTDNNNTTFNTYKNDTNYVSKIGMCTLRHSSLYATDIYYIGNTPTYESKILYSWYQKIQDDNNTSSGDTGGTTGSGDGGNTGESKVDLTKIENGIGQINQNIGKTNEKLDEIKESIPTSGDISGVIENTFSGDVPPIDENKVNDKFNDIQNEIDNKLGLFDYSNFLFSIANGLATSLLGTGNVEIELKLPSGQIQKINSKDITNKNTELKQFLSVFSNTAIIITLVISIQWIINKIKEGDIIYMLDLGDAEMYFYKDMNMM